MDVLEGNIKPAMVIMSNGINTSITSIILFLNNSIRSFQATIRL